MSFRKIADRQAQKFEEESRSFTPWHSRYYHREFEGWEEASVLNKDGKGTTIRRVYRGKYYVPSMDLRDSGRFKAELTGMGAFSVVLFLIAGCLNAFSNYCWYTVLPYALAIPCLVNMILSLVTICGYRTYITIPKYRQGIAKFRKWILPAALSVSAAAILTLVNLLLKAEIRTKPQYAYEIFMLLTTFLLGKMTQIGKTASFKEVPNSENPEMLILD